MPDPSRPTSSAWLVFALWAALMATFSAVWWGRAAAPSDPLLDARLSAELASHQWPRLGEPILVLSDRPCACDADASARLADWARATGTRTVTMPTPQGRTVIVDAEGRLTFAGDAAWLVDGCTGQAGWRAMFRALAERPDDAPVVMATRCTCNALDGNTSSLRPGAENNRRHARAT